MKPRIVVTRPQPLADRWLAAAAGHGLEAVALPLLVLAPPPDAAAARRAWLELRGHAQAIAFISPNAVAALAALVGEGVFAAWPAASCRAAAVGRGTAAALRRAGVPTDAIVEPGEGISNDAEGLWRSLVPLGPWQGRHVGIVRGAGGRELLDAWWRAAGARVQEVIAYQRLDPLAAGLADGPAWQTTWRQVAGDPDGHLWLLTSSEAVRALPALAAAVGAVGWHAQRALALHPRIAQTAREVGFGHVDVLERSEPAAVAAYLGCQGRPLTTMPAS